MRISLQQASALLNQGKVVGVPTETVYGLAAGLSHPEAIKQVFFLKGRPAKNPLIIHIADAEHVLNYIKAAPTGYADLAAAFWPGPMTLVLPVKLEVVPAIVRAELATAAFRVPGHNLTLQLLELTGPLVMPSANLSGKPSSTCADHVEEDFGKEFPVLDGGVCHKGLESTILFFRENKWVVVRQGALAPEHFVSALGYVPEIIGAIHDAAPLCPGQLYRHYAPKASLRLKGCPSENSVVIGFSDRVYPTGCRFLSLGNSNDSETAAQRLYAVLRQLDEEEIQEAWVDMQFADEGLWLTLKERLRKAAQ